MRGVTDKEGAQRVEPPAAAPAAPSAAAETAPTPESLRRHPAYRALSATDRRVADRILEHAETSPRRAYYLTKLKLLLDTPYRDPTTAVTTTRGVAKPFAERQLDKLTDALRRAAALLAKVPAEERAAYLRREESATDAVPAREWEARPAGYGNKIFWVSRRDPENIRVKVNIYLDANPEIERSVLHLEDAIEKYVSIPGFTVNLRFVKREAAGRRDVVTVKADPTQWTTALNWVGTYESLAHELMHVLGLKDEYDMIDVHAGNANMKVGARLHWFSVQMTRPPPPADANTGIMTCRGRTLRRHARQVAGLPPEQPDAASRGVTLRPQPSPTSNPRRR